MKSLPIAAALTLGMWAALPAAAQDTQMKQQKAQPAQAGQQATKSDQQQGDQPPVILMKDWNYDKIYQEGWSVKKLMDVTVIGVGGDDIGEVKNVIISEKGRILGVIAEVGGFLDIADTHVFIPWNQVKFNRGLKRITIPVTQENVEDYAYDDARLIKAETTGRTAVVESGLQVGPGIWKATELLESRAALNGNVGYGWISDLIFTTGGDLHAVVVNADAMYRGGYYAYPYYGYGLGYGYGWRAGAPHYNLGYDKTDIVNLKTKFDDKKMNDRIVMKHYDGKDDAATTGAAPDDRSKGPKKDSK